MEKGQLALCQFSPALVDLVEMAAIRQYACFDLRRPAKERGDRRNILARRAPDAFVLGKVIGDRRRDRGSDRVEPSRPVGAHVLQFLARDGMLDQGLKIRTLCLPDIFFEHDKPEKQVEMAGLDAKGIVASVEALVASDGRRFVGKAIGARGMQE